MNLFRSFLLLTLFLTSSLHSQIILTSDHQLDLLTNPDQELDLSTGFKKRITSLRKICEKLQKENKTYLTIAFDEFFRQYRDHPPTERVLTPDMDEYVKKIKKIADFAAQFDLGMGLSLLSPLELGPSYKNQTGNHGTWYHYKVGHRDPTTGKFNVGLWQQLLWSNNKGNFNIKLKSYKAYAFKEKKIGNTQFKSVDRDSILPLKDIDYDSWGIGEREFLFDISTPLPERKNLISQKPKYAKKLSRELVKWSEGNAKPGVSNKLDRESDRFDFYFN